MCWRRFYLDSKLDIVHLINIDRNVLLLKFELCVCLSYKERVVWIPGSNLFAVWVGITSNVIIICQLKYLCNITSLGPR